MFSIFDIFFVINVHDLFFCSDSHEDRSPTYLEIIKSSTEESPQVELHATAKAVVTELLNVLPLRLLEEQKKESEKKSKKKEDDSLLFNTKSILSFLAELIKSYPAVAKVFCDHSYPRGKFLAYILSATC